MHVTPTGSEQNCNRTSCRAFLLATVIRARQRGLSPAISRPSRNDRARRLTKLYDANRHVRTEAQRGPVALPLTYPHDFCRASAKVIDSLAHSPTYVHFLSNHLISNRPVVIGRDLTEAWPAFQLWASANDKGKINWDHLVNNYGAQAVSVTDCRAPPADSCTEDATLGEVVRKWQTAEDDTAENNQPLLYIKDWHLARSVSRSRALEPFYTTPYLFADDWLNYHYCNFTDDDFRFVYLGVQGTSTPFHKDVYDSYSWSTNVIGRKSWTFWAPDDEARKQPGVELVQEAGETVFVYVPATFLSQ